MALQKTAFYGPTGHLATLKSGGGTDLEVLYNFAFMLKVARMHRWPPRTKIALQEGCSKIAQKAQASTLCRSTFRCTFFMISIFLFSQSLFVSTNVCPKIKAICFFILSIQIHFCAIALS